MKITLWLGTSDKICPVSESDLVAKFKPYPHHHNWEMSQTG